MKLKEESEKFGLKSNIQKTKIMASSPVTSQKRDGETDFIVGGSKSPQMVSAAMKLKSLVPWKESYDQPTQHIIKQRHYFTNKIYLVKAMVSPVVIYECESWTIKKAES